MPHRSKKNRNIIPEWFLWKATFSNWSSSSRNVPSQAITYTACSIMPVIIVLLKISIFILHRTKMMDLIKYTQENFWYREYDDFGEMILKRIDNKGILLMCSFTFFVQGTAVTYTLTPIIGKLSNNSMIFLSFFFLSLLTLVVRQPGW